MNIELPLEIIDHILYFADASTLYQLIQVSHVLRYLSTNHLYHHHLQHASIRLWMHQPGTMAHTPIDFNQPTLASFDTVHFSFANHQPIQFNHHQPVYVDGCTIQHNNNNGSKQHYSITYQSPIMMTKGDSTTWTIEKQKQWSMSGEYEDDDHDGDHVIFKPSSSTGLSCNLHLFHPSLLTKVVQQQTLRLQERIQSNKRKQQPNKTFFAPCNNNDVKSPDKLDIATPPSKYHSPWFTSISS
ncbi:uncharacterized protein BX664DRAFT_343235 [Halteromyces radiatus]|uniref:uncharacterized protein n=1 Tax=Halteromyces radiatus TaxID=101107 RepID=UPI002220E406|nr:uncharacterized protein BX664DRAFT_343235 [Halteromyces radiatus]KAI8077689.1 hypothetical protein BX664DRAFT_343235 [Halteromyces radiatus]